MNRKIIIIITVLICLCAALITAQHFANKNTENTTAPTTLSETPQTVAPTESATDEHPSADNSASHTNEKESANQTAGGSQNVMETSSKNGGSKESTSSGSRPTESKKESTKATSSEKENSTETTKKPQGTTTAATTKSTTATESTTKEEKQSITVTISISCEKAREYGKDVPESGYFLAPCKFTAKKGATVFDVLEAAAKENGITLTYQSKAYIQAINGLAEKDCGGGSGWTYKVNGTKPNKSAAKYELADGDIIEWYYVTSPND